MHRCVSIAFIVTRSIFCHFSISHFYFMVPLLPSPWFFLLVSHVCVCVARHQRCHAIRMPLHSKSQQRHTTCLWQFPFCSKQKCITNWFESFSSCLCFFCCTILNASSFAAFCLRSYWTTSRTVCVCVCVALSISICRKWNFIQTNWQNYSRCQWKMNECERGEEKNRSTSFLSYLTHFLCMHYDNSATKQYEWVCARIRNCM